MLVLKYHICNANLVDSGCLDLDWLGVLPRKQPHFEAGYFEGVEDGTFAPGKKNILLSCSKVSKKDMFLKNFFDSTCSDLGI